MMMMMMMTMANRLRPHHFALHPRSRRHARDDEAAATCLLRRARACWPQDAPSLLAPSAPLPSLLVLSLSSSLQEYLPLSPSAVKKSARARTYRGVRVLNTPSKVVAGAVGARRCHRAAAAAKYAARTCGLPHYVQANNILTSSSIITL